MCRPLLRLHPVGKMLLALIIMAIGFPCWETGKLLLLCGLVLMLLALDYQVGLVMRVLRVSSLSVLVSLVAFAIGNSAQAALGAALHLEILLLLSLLMFQTPVSDLLRGLQSCKVPDDLLLGFMIVFRFIDVLQDELQTIHLASTMLPRGSMSITKRLYRCLMLPFVYRLFVLSDQLTLSVNSRDFGAAKRGQYRENPLRLLDGGVLALSAVLCGVVVWML